MSRRFTIRTTEGRKRQIRVPGKVKKTPAKKTVKKPAQVKKPKPAEPVESAVEESGHGEFFD